MTIDFRKKSNIDYLLVYLLAAVSGMPFFEGDVPVIGAFGITFLVFVLRKDSFHRSYFFFLFAFLILLLLHSLRENYFPQNTYIGFVVKLTLGYLVVATVNKDFTKYYINILVFLSIASFFFFLPLLVSTSFDDIFNSIGVLPPFEPGTRKSLILYQLNLQRPDGLYRNCGPFWEPAAFGGFLLVALMFNMAETGKLKGKKNMILIITAISTLSTTIFILLAILIFFYFFVSQKFLVKLITVPIVLTMFVVAFVQLSFLKEKMMIEWRKGDMSYEMRKSDQVGHTRLSSGIADYYDFMEYPLLGRGIFPTSYFDVRDTKTRHNGLTKQIAQFGFLGIFLYFIPVFLSLNRLVLFSNLKNALGIVFFIIVLGMGISEGYFDKSFFWGLLFLHLVMLPQSSGPGETIAQNQRKMYV